MKITKKKVWVQFSKWIRSRGSFNDKNVCVTCKAVLPIKSLQAGHFVPGRTNSILFEETNCHPQCLRCNIFLRGNLIPYYRFMVKTYGEKEINRLLKLKDKPKKLTPKDLEKLYVRYKNP